MLRVYPNPEMQVAPFIPAGYEALRCSGFEPEALATMLRGTRLKLRLLRGGELWQAHTQRLLFEGSSLEAGRFNLPLLGQGHLPPGQVAFGLLLDAQEPGFLNGLPVLPGSLRLFAEGAELDYRTAVGTHWTLFRAERARLQQAAVHLLGRELPLPNSGLRNLPATPAAQVLAQQIRALLASAASGQLPPAQCAAALLLPAYVRALGEAAGVGDDTGAEPAAPRTLQFAREHLMARLHEPFDMLALCAATGRTERALQYAFKRAFGIGPQAWFEAMRLGEAHHALRASGPGGVRISDVATDFGFTHLGRFAVAYRRLFGERPSQTLARA